MQRGDSSFHYENCAIDDKQDVDEEGRGEEVGSDGDVVEGMEGVEEK